MRTLDEINSDMDSLMKEALDELNHPDFERKCKFNPLQLSMRFNAFSKRMKDLKKERELKLQAIKDSK